MPAIFRLAGDTSPTDTPVDTSTNAPSILAINGFFCGFTVVVVLARMYVRSIMLKTLGVDDILILFATVKLFFSCPGPFSHYDWQSVVSKGPSCNCRGIDSVTSTRLAIEELKTRWLFQIVSLYREHN